MSARPAAIAFIFALVVVDVIAMGVVIPVLPKLVESFEGGDTARAAAVYGVFGTAWAVMQFFSMPLLGALSDRFGRRPVILVSCFGLGLDYFLMALAPNLAWLFVGRVISGITAASVSTAFAYIADVTPPEKRAAAFGIVGAGFGLGFTLGPALGGVLGGIDPRLPFWVAGCLALANACYGWFVLPESLPKEKRAAFAWKRANPVGSLRLLRSHRELTGLAAVLFLMQLAHVVFPAVTVLYMGYRFGWGETAVGFVLAAVGVASMVVQGGLIRPVVKRLGERRALVAGLVFGTAGMAIYGAAPTGWLFLAGIPVMALWGLGGPSAQSLMSRRVEPSEQGQLQGATSAMQAITGMIGPTLFTQVFAHSIAKDGAAHVPGMAFFVGAAMLAVGAAIAWRVTRDAR
ncbi:MAG: TCR/Tet family MFS transporter [Burkholderiales bacterium]|nr:TCR/Tet family MFS transporter [Burkholderiales bacterium]MBX3717357.1 TCR/Tet family MFS transporter [Burkholderiales bacterium]MBZ0248392.1 TCR/Tet family MFS transporter [Burkholderiales bacterium]MCL4687485.1 TCR/Tet family MFS transporter [Burkholderiales bacterium]